MKILYVVRLFSGLEESLQRRQWKPTGAPTSFKLIEALDRSDHDTRFVFTAKDGKSQWNETGDCEFSVTNLRNPVVVLAGMPSIPKRFGSLRGYLRDLRHCWRIWQMVRQGKPDLIYIGHANIWAAGFLARFQKVPVVFRVMGIYPVMREALTGSRPAFRLLRWAYRAPYAAVVVSQDGSGVEKWLHDALAPKIPRYCLLNGVEVAERPETPDPRLQSLPRDRTVVLFLGRLDAAKGCDEFLEAFLAARESDPERLHALIIGTGQNADTMIARVHAADATENVTFIDRLPHDQVMEAHARSDIYVSLNRLGNLSNANLEAMKAGQCMIFPEAQVKEGIDVTTDTLVPPDAVTRIPSTGSVAKLTEAILRLHRSPERRAAQRAAMRQAADFIPNWQTRIDIEIEILDALCNGASPHADIGKRMSSSKP